MWAPLTEFHDQREAVFLGRLSQRGCAFSVCPTGGRLLCDTNQCQQPRSSGSRKVASAQTVPYQVIFPSGVNTVLEEICETGTIPFWLQLQTFPTDVSVHRDLACSHCYDSAALMGFPKLPRAFYIPYLDGI